MRRKRSSYHRLLAIGAAAALIVAGVATVALAAGDATTSAKKAKVKCPKKVRAGKKKVTCKIVGKLPKGPKGAKGARGAKGATGAQGPAGSPGLSGYQIASQDFAEVFVENSGGMRGLSEVKTVLCPAGKRAIGGGSDLGTDSEQNGQQRQVTVSLSGPNSAGTGWSVQLFNNSVSIDTSIDLRLYAICVNAG
jgi:hypothetical protein